MPDNLIKAAKWLLIVAVTCLVVGLAVKPVFVNQNTPRLEPYDVKMVEVGRE